MYGKLEVSEADAERAREIVALLEKAGALIREMALDMRDEQRDQIEPQRLKVSMVKYQNAMGWYNRMIPRLLCDWKKVLWIMHRVRVVEETRMQNNVWDEKSRGRVIDARIYDAAKQP